MTGASGSGGRGGLEARGRFAGGCASGKLLDTRYRLRRGGFGDSRGCANFGECLRHLILLLGMTS
jgi:hypothetical protein